MIDEAKRDRPRRRCGELAGWAFLLTVSLGLGGFLLLIPPPAAAQDLETAINALVRISGTREGTPVRGSGFVVAIDRDKATIVTASHVEGVQELRVMFAADPTESYATAEVFGMEAQDPNGLAAFQVRGSLPKELAWLHLEAERRPRRGEDLFLLGFPEMSLTPRSLKSALSGWAGALLVIDREAGEGFSGGPVLQDDKVVGVVTTVDGQSRAVNAVVAREVLLGWGVKQVVRVAVPAPAPIATLPAARLAPSQACIPGEELAEKVSGIVFVRICGGTFTMGSPQADQLADSDEKPPHPVTVSEFWIGKTEITNAQYRLLQPKHEGEAQLPAANISWEDAKSACESFGGRLPTEAEWECAARAGSRTPWSFGANEKKIGEYAWYAGNSGGKAHSVGEKKANAWGLHDMLGNVLEWVSDWLGDYPKGAQTDPTGPAKGEYRVLRGGSFANVPRHLRSAFRSRDSPGDQDQDVGFRCVLRAPH